MKNLKLSTAFIILSTKERVLCLVDIDRSVDEDRISLYYPLLIIPDEYGQYTRTDEYYIEDYLFGSADKIMTISAADIFHIATMSTELESVYRQFVTIVPKNDNITNSELSNIKNVVSINKN